MIFFRMYLSKVFKNQWPAPWMRSDKAPACAKAVAPPVCIDCLQISGGQNWCSQSKNRDHVGENLLERSQSCGCKGNKLSQRHMYRVMILVGSGALIIFAMCTLFPSNVVSALWAGNRNSYLFLIHTRELRRTTLRKSQMSQLSLTAISPRHKSPVNLVLSMARNRISS